MASKRLSIPNPTRPQPLHIPKPALHTLRIVDQVSPSSAHVEDASVEERDQKTLKQVAWHPHLDLAIPFAKGDV